MGKTVRERASIFRKLSLSVLAVVPNKICDIKTIHELLQNQCGE